MNVALVYLFGLIIRIMRPNTACCSYRF